jgi:hypothetical protein
MALLAYHGGKNGFYEKPGWHRAYSYDIRSAYCWAMTHIPDMTRGAWEAIAEPPPPGEFGFLAVSGKLPATRYPVLYDYEFKPLRPGAEVRDLVITSQEWDCLDRHGTGGKWESVCGVLWRTDRPGDSDLARYAREVYARRLAAGSEAERTLYKLLANSLYGKFIARTPVEEWGADRLLLSRKWRRGQLFYAPVAAWITALVRSRITDLEHRHGAIHTSTDGFLTRAPIPASDLADELGGLKFVASGPCLILRNKLYLHFDPRGRLQYAALHGFQGSPRDLWRIVQSGKPVYSVHRLLGWLEARRADGLPYTNLTRAMALHVREVRSWERQDRNPYGLRPRWNKSGW